MDRVAGVQDKYPSLKSSSIDVHEDYGLSHSFKRGSTSEALNRGVTEMMIDRNNR